VGSCPFRPHSAGLSDRLGLCSVWRFHNRTTRRPVDNNCSRQQLPSVFTNPGTQVDVDDTERLLDLLHVLLATVASLGGMYSVFTKGGRRGGPEKLLDFLDVLLATVASLGGMNSVFAKPGMQGGRCRWCGEAP
jgi:hypothetical protein